MRKHRWFGPLTSLLENSKEFLNPFESLLNDFYSSYETIPFSSFQHAYLNISFCVYSSRIVNHSKAFFVNNRLVVERNWDACESLLSQAFELGYFDKAVHREKYVCEWEPLRFLNGGSFTFSSLILCVHFGFCIPPCARRT